MAAAAGASGQDVNRAFRQYNAVEPENRLVARTLERTWEQALLAQRALEEEYRSVPASAARTVQRGGACPDRGLGPRSAGAVAITTTSVEEKRQVVRLLLQRVVVWAPSSTHEVKVQLHWTGGTVTEHQVSRGVRTWEQVADATDNLATCAGAGRPRVGPPARWRTN